MPLPLVLPHPPCLFLAEGKIGPEELQTNDTGNDYRYL